MGEIMTRTGSGFSLEMSETQLMEDLVIGSVTSLPVCAKGIEAKLRMAEVLGIDINCVRRL